MIPGLMTEAVSPVAAPAFELRRGESVSREPKGIEADG